METVRCYFDPMCPWAYQTSKWLRELRDRSVIAIDWRFFSLEEVNLEPGKKHPWERPWSYGWSQLRIAARLRRDGQELVDRWYAAAGEAFFERGEPTFLREGAEELLTSIGLPAGLVAEALDDPTTTDEVRADHEELVRHHGGHGVPTLVFEDGQALFGPVVLGPVGGGSALRLWELVRGWREFPDLFEIRRPKTDADLGRIGSAFSTYVQARAWRTIENPAR